MENSTIVFGDIHGLTVWKQIVADNPDCRCVFLGDYLDPYRKISRKNLISNLEEIIRLKQEQPDNVVLLLGNHDLHYITDKILQSSRWDYDIAPQAFKLFSDNIELFQFAYQEDDCVFTHAGIAHDWFTDCFKGDVRANIAEQLNKPAPEQEAFLYACGSARGGFASIGGVFWADILELHKPLHGFTQIVGHNRVDEIAEITGNGGRIIFCDCLYNGHYLKI